jgi:methylmalonyl-CoA/ethylmalonyl-CoA epimerase
MAEKPIFTGVLQIAVVVKDLDESMKKYWEEYGIGPWTIYTFDPSTVSDMIIRNERMDYAMRLALTDIDGVQWELIEPLDEKSIYAEFLKEHGEGLHHVAFGVDNYDEAMAAFKGKGIGVLQAGTWHGLTYTYLESEDTLSMIAEIYDMPEGFEFPPPEATYP